MIIINLHETLNKQKQTKQSQKITRSDKSIAGTQGNMQGVGVSKSRGYLWEWQMTVTKENEK